MSVFVSMYFLSGEHDGSYIKLTSASLKRNYGRDRHFDRSSSV